MDIKRWFKIRKLKAYCKREGIDPSYGIFNGMVVKEFNYLLEYISNNEMRSMKSYESIHKNYNKLLESINQEICSPKLKEEEYLNQCHEIAVNNMKNLKRILREIYSFVDYQNSLGLTRQ